MFIDSCEALSANLYVRVADHHVNILITSPRARGGNKLSCLALTSLSWIRKGPKYIFIASTDKHWATKIFGQTFCSTIWRQPSLLIILCMLLWDVILPGSEIRLFSMCFEESEEFFGGMITHDGAVHALTVYRADRVDFIWMTASIWSGDNRASPIWKAFLTPKDAFNNWSIEAQDGPFAKLCNIRRHYFADDYIGSRFLK